MKKFKYRLATNSSDYLSRTCFEFMVRRVTVLALKTHFKPKFTRTNCMTHNSFKTDMCYVYK
jgi:hypothetical protein